VAAEPDHTPEPEAAQPHDAGFANERVQAMTLAVSDLSTRGQLDKQTDWGAPRFDRVDARWAAFEARFERLEHEIREMADLRAETHRQVRDLCCKLAEGPVLQAGRIVSLVALL
jgi:hypothetical protein